MDNIIDANTRGERRLSRRFPAGLPAKLLLAEDNNIAVMSGKLTNISLKGSCIISLNGNHVDEIGSGSFVLRLDKIKGIRDGILEVAVKLKWASSLTNGLSQQYGVQFADITEDQKILISRIIGLLTQTGKSDVGGSNAIIVSLPRYSERIPHDSRKDYSEKVVEIRRAWLDQVTKSQYKHISHYSINPEQAKGNIENFVGVAQVPIGIFGPLKINGTYARGIFYVPLATTEGGITVTHQRGAIAITRSGGAQTHVHADENHLDPVFHCSGLMEAIKLSDWVKENIGRFKGLVQRASSHGTLNSITPHIIARRVILDFAYSTHDAMGANLINMLTEACCELIASEFGNRDYFLRSNFSSEKKSSGAQLVNSCGKSLTAEVVLPKRIVEKYLKTTPAVMSKAWRTWAISSVNAGMIGFNAQFANGLAAIYIACGQDVAHITNGSVGMTMFELTEQGDLYAAVKLPNLIVGTVGGGTALPTQSECLKMLGCYGRGKARKFSEIIAAAILAGEISICAGITSGHFQDPHKRARFFTRLKAFEQE